MPFLTHNALRLTERTITLPRLPEAFDGFRLIHLSDLHFYEYTDPDYYARVADIINDSASDAIALTGDIVHYGEKYISQAAAFLSRIEASHKFAIIGNHDFHDGAEGAQIGATLQECGYTFLRNENASIERHGNALHFAGLDDLWYGIPDIAKGLEGIPSNQATVVLAHNPLLFDPIAHAFSERVDLVLSGHTHAGHVYIPVLGPIYRKIFRMKYRYGLFEKNGCQMHVTSGVGSAAFYLKKKRIGFPRFRFNTHPEIALLTLTQNKSNRKPQ
ncbi:MAG TPA: metallophosphoesterase [Oculatellaceae cyanobacterium]|jgi:predicted MPP superfamily phosphohydrolase